MLDMAALYNAAQCDAIPLDRSMICDASPHQVTQMHTTNG